jgi:hypothetical protein
MFAPSVRSARERESERARERERVDAAGRGGGGKGVFPYSLCTSQFWRLWPSDVSPYVRALLCYE